MEGGAARSEYPRVNGAPRTQPAQLTELPQFQVGVGQDGVLPERLRDGVRLTPRQLECLHWAGEGKSSVDIASILAISPATVDGHIAEACARLGVRTRIQAIVEAYRRGWLK